MSILTTVEFIADGAINNDKVVAGAGIEFSKLEKVPLAADGTNAASANLDFGGFIAINSGTASAASDVPNWGQVQSEISAQVGTGSHLESVGTRAIAPPGAPTTGDRVLIDSVLGVATGAFTGQENNVAEYNGSTWDFEAVSGAGKWIGVNDESTKLYYFDNVAWSAKDFENTTVDEATLTKTGSLITIKNGGVGAIQLATDAVTTIKITDLNVTTAKIADNAITLDKMADNSVGTDEIVNGSVTDAELATDSVITVKIANLNVTSAKLATDSVITTKIADLNVTTAKLADGAITTDKVVNLGGALRFLSHNGTDNDILEQKQQAFLTSSFTGSNPAKEFDLTDTPVGGVIDLHIQGKKFTQGVHFNLISDGASIKRIQLIATPIPNSGTDCLAGYWFPSV